MFLHTPKPISERAGFVEIMKRIFVRVFPYAPNRPTRFTDSAWKQVIPWSEKPISRSRNSIRQPIPWLRVHPVGPVAADVLRLRRLFHRHPRSRHAGIPPLIACMIFAIRHHVFGPVRVVLQKRDGADRSPCRSQTSQSSVARRRRPPTGSAPDPSRPWHRAPERGCCRHAGTTPCRPNHGRCARQWTGRRLP